MEINDKQFKQELKKFEEDINKLQQGSENVIKDVQESIKNQFTDFSEISDSPEAAYAKAEINNQITGGSAGTIIKNVPEKEVPAVKKAVINEAIRAYIKHCIFGGNK